MTATQINTAVRQACRAIRLNAPDKKVAKALELLGVEREAAFNHGLAHFDSKSITKSVKAYFEQ